jgi:hypothetical protein
MRILLPFVLASSLVGCAATTHAVSALTGSGKPTQTQSITITNNVEPAKVVIEQPKEAPKAKHSTLKAAAVGAAIGAAVVVAAYEIAR